MPEIWKPVLGYEGLYEVSSYGKIRSVRICPNSYVGKVLKPWIVFNRNNKLKQLQIHLSRNNKRIAKSVHVLVLEAFVGKKPEGQEGCHIDGNPRNNNVENLRWDTHVNNELDKLIHRTNGRKLSPEDVIQIRRYYSSGNYTQKQLAIKYGVSQSHLSRAIRGVDTRWEWLEVAKNG